MSIQFDVTGTGDLEKAIEKAMKQFPQSAENALKKETREIRKEIRAEYIEDTIKSKRKNWKKALKKKDKKSLVKSFNAGKVIKNGNKYTSAVVTKAPHYHLVEEGHEASGWYAEQQNAQRIEGKRIVAKIMAKRSENAEEIGQRVLDEILRDAGLD